MYHSLIFQNDKNTWADWYMIPTSRPVINPPEVKTKIVDIPGADWHLDLSTVLTGDVAYGSRTGSIEFLVDNGQLSAYRAERWASLYSEVMDYLHGKTRKMMLEDDASFYYQGRFTVNQWASEPHNSKITIDYDLAPYKYEYLDSIFTDPYGIEHEGWLWDTFNFETDIVREYKELTVKNSMELTIIGRRMAVIPTIRVISGTNLKVTFKGTTYDLVKGDNRFVTLKTTEGENKLKFTGNGVVSVIYRGGCL